MTLDEAQALAHAIAEATQSESRVVADGESFAVNVTTTSGTCACTTKPTGCG
jgi:hypothetical protein